MDVLSISSVEPMYLVLGVIGLIIMLFILFKVTKTAVQIFSIIVSLIILLFIAEFVLSLIGFDSLANDLSSANGVLVDIIVSLFNFIGSVVN